MENKETVNTFIFPCRGCTYKGREMKWHNFASSISDERNRQIDNSYLTLKAEPNNPVDPNAIQVLIRGEFYGTAGYVGREFTKEIKEIMKKSKWYRVDMQDENDIGKSVIPLVLSWVEKTEEDEFRYLQGLSSETKRMVIDDIKEGKKNLYHSVMSVLFNRAKNGELLPSKEEEAEIYIQKFKIDDTRKDKIKELVYFCYDRREKKKQNA